MIIISKLINIKYNIDTIKDYIIFNWYQFIFLKLLPHNLFCYFEELFVSLLKKDNFIVDKIFSSLWIGFKEIDFN